MVWACLILVPFMILAPGLVHGGHHIGFIIAATACLASCVGDKQARLFGYYVVAWALFVRVRFMLGLSPSLQEPGEAFGSLLFIAMGYAVYIAARDSKTSAATIYNLICVAAIGHCVLAAAQMNGISPVFFVYGKLFSADYGDLPRTWPVSCFGNTNFFAGYLAVSAAFFLRPGWKKWLWFVVIPTMIATQTATAMVAVCVGLTWYFRAWKTGLAALCAVLVLAWFDNAAVGLLGGRTDIWAPVLKRIFSDPVAVAVGFGPGVGTGRNFPVHNEWLQAWHTYGLVGVCLAAYFVLRSVHDSNRVMAAAVIMIAVNCLGNYPLHLGPTAFLIAAIFGLNERLRHGRYTRKKFFWWPDSIGPKGSVP